MNQYLLATYAVAGEVPGAPTAEEMQGFMGKVMALEAEMDAANVFVFGGALGKAEAAMVIADDGTMTEGPLAQSNAHIAGFYIINAADMEAAREWGLKVAAATSHSIEVREFRATGRVADHMG